MKKFFIIVLVIIVVTVVATFTVQRNEVVAPTVDSGPATDTATKKYTGTVTDVSTEQMAVDGPGLITFENDMGESYVVAIPSFGIRLCAAFENLVDVDEVEVGDSIAVQGFYNLDQNYIVPCEDPSDFVRIDRSR
jgi:hypothetical protein